MAARDWVGPPGLLESSSHREPPEARSEQRRCCKFGWRTSKRKCQDRTLKRQEGRTPESGIEVWRAAVGGLGRRRRIRAVITGFSLCHFPAEEAPTRPAGVSRLPRLPD